MAKRISILVALEGADEGLKRAITSAERSLGELSTTAKTAGATAAAGMAEVKAGMSAFGDQVATAKTQLLAFLSINWAAGKVQEIVQIADAWNMMSARLKLATAGSREYTVAQKELFAISQRIGVPIQETATLYGKLQQAVRMLGEAIHRDWTYDPDATTVDTPATEAFTATSETRMGFVQSPRSASVTAARSSVTCSGSLCVRRNVVMAQCLGSRSIAMTRKPTSSNARASMPVPQNGTRAIGRVCGGSESRRAW